LTSQNRGVVKITFKQFVYYHLHFIMLLV